jgi:hypothetical protein
VSRGWSKCLHRYAVQAVVQEKLILWQRLFYTLQYISLGLGNRCLIPWRADRVMPSKIDCLSSFMEHRPHLLPCTIHCTNCLIPLRVTSAMSCTRVDQAHFPPFTTHLNAPHLPNQRQPCIVVMTYSTPPVLLTSKCNMCTQVNIPVPKHHAKTHCHRTKMPKSIPPSNTAPSNTCTRSLHTIQQLSQQDRASLCS